MWNIFRHVLICFSFIQTYFDLPNPLVLLHHLYFLQLMEGNLLPSSIIRCCFFIICIFCSSLKVSFCHLLDSFSFCFAIFFVTVVIAVAIFFFQLRIWFAFGNIFSAPSKWVSWTSNSGLKQISLNLIFQPIENIFGYAYHILSPYSALFFWFCQVIVNFLFFTSSLLVFFATTFSLPIDLFFFFVFFKAAACFFFRNIWCNQCQPYFSL